MEKNKTRIKAKLIKMIQKYEKYKRISDSMEYSESWWYKFCTNRTEHQRFKIDLFMLENYQINEAMVSDILEGRAELDDVLKLTDPDADLKNEIDYLSIPYILDCGERVIRDKKLEKYYATQRVKQGWCYYDVIDINWSLNGYAAGLLETYVCKVPDYRTPCLYFVEEYYEKFGNELSMNFDEFCKLFRDHEFNDEKTREKFEEIRNKIREYQFKTIRQLVNILRLGADIDGAGYHIADGEKRVKEAKEAFKKVLEFYDQLMD